MSKYPAQIDNGTSLPLAVDNFTPVEAKVFNDARSAILAIEGELGVKPSGIYGTVKSRLETIESSIANFPAVRIGGDLGNTGLQPYVIGIHGNPISSVAPNVGEVLTWQGSSWAPAPTSGVIVFGGDLSGTSTSQTVTKIQGNAVINTLLTVNQDGYILTWVNASNQWQVKPAPSGFTAGGDLTGTPTNQTLSKLQGKTLGTSLASIGASQDGYTLTWANSAAEWQAKSTAAGFTAGGDLTGTSTSQRVYQLTGVISLEQYGAVGDGITNDNAAWTAALAALTGGTGSGNHTIQLGSNRTYLIGTGGTLPAGCSIIGYGESSVLTTTGNGNIVVIGGDDCTLSNFKIAGDNNGAHTSQNGISCSYRKTKITNVHTTACGNYGMLFLSFGGGQSLGAQVSNCISDLNWTAQFAVASAEYCTFSNCVANGFGLGAYGIYIAAGNTCWTGGDITNNHTGVYVDSSGNDTHGVFAGAQINHNSNANVNFATATTNGFNFIGCQFYENPLIHTNASGLIKYIGCAIDVTYYATTNSNVEFTGCRFQNNYGNTVNAPTGNPIVWGPDNIMVDGTIPTWIPFTTFTNAPTTQWSSVTVAPTLKQADVTTNSATGAILTLQAQNATGTTSTGGNLILQSGTGTSTQGSIIIKAGATTALTATSTAITLASLAGSGAGIVGVSNTGVLSFESFSALAGSVTLAGDVTGAANANTTVKIQGKSLSASLTSIGATQDGYALTWVNGSSEWQAKPTSAGFTANGDLAGTPTSQQVISLTGSAGTLNIASTAAILQWASTSTAPTLKMATHATTPQPLTIQSANVTTGTGSDIILQSGSGSVTSGKISFKVGSVEGGSFVQTAVAGGNIVGILGGNAAGTSYCVMAGGYPGFETSNGAIWILPQGTVRTASNLAISADATSTAFGGPSNLYFGVGATNYMRMRSTDFVMGMSYVNPQYLFDFATNAGFHFGAAATVSAAIFYDQATTATVGKTLSIVGQAGGSGGGAQTGGNVNIISGLGTAGGASGNVIIAIGAAATPVLTLSPSTASTGDYRVPATWALVAGSGGDRPIIRIDGSSNIIIGATGGVIGVIALRSQSSIDLTTSTINVNTAASGSIYIETIAAAYTQVWDSTVTSITLSQATHATVAHPMTIQAGNTTTGTGSSLTLQSGTGSVAAGDVSLKSGATTIATANATGFVLAAKLTLANANISTSPFTIDSGANHCMLFVDSTSIAITVNLPAPTAGRILVIKDSGFNAATNNITIARHAAEKIEGVAASRILSSNGMSIILTSNGTDWYQV